MSQSQQQQEEHREFINNFIHRYIDDRRLPGVTRIQMQEMEQVLQSVSFGKQELFKKAQFQAFSAAISNQAHVDLVMRYICQKAKILQSKSKIVAYRVAP